MCLSVRRRFDTCGNTGRQPFDALSYSSCFVDGTNTRISRVRRSTETPVGWNRRQIAGFGPPSVASASNSDCSFLHVLHTCARSINGERACALLYTPLISTLRSIRSRSLCPLSWFSVARRHDRARSVDRSHLSPSRWSTLGGTGPLGAVSDRVLPRARSTSRPSSCLLDL